MNKLQAPPMKKKKLDILREGGLEVTPISHSQNGEFIFPRETSALLAMFPQLSNVKSRLEMPPPLTNGVSSKNHSKAKDKVTTTPATTTKCPPALFQSVSMYQTTTKIFGNPKDFLPAGPSYSNVTKSDGGLDLSVKPGSAGNLGQPGGSRKRMAAPPAAHTNLSKSNWPILPENLTITKKSPIAPLSYLPKKHYMNQVN